MVSTADKLAEMLTENTGKSILDSGGMSGRRWQRNQGMTTADFIARPAVLIDDYGASLDVFHWLNERVSYSPDIDAMWRAYDDAHPDDSWFESADNWVELVGEDDGYWSGFGWVNTYNGDCALDGTLQFLPFVLGGESYVLLQIHGGADVRGGYTRPVVFSTDESILMFCDMDLRCSKDCGYIQFESSRISDSDIDADIPDTWEPQHGCPKCGAVMQ